MLGQELGTLSKCRRSNSLPAPGSIVTRIATRPERLDVRAYRSDLPPTLARWILAASAAQPADRPVDVTGLLSGSPDEEDGADSTADLDGPPTVEEPAPPRARAGDDSDRWLVVTSIGLALVALLVAWRLFSRENAAELPVAPIVVTSSIAATSSVGR